VASALHSVADVRGRRYAISRRGSGSHIMAYVHARDRGWSVDALELVAIGNLAGAVAAFAAGTADVFFWEKFMTKPLVDAGQFRRVGEFVAPWPAFVLCIADKTGAEQRAALAKLFSAVLAQAQALATRVDAAQLIGARYALAPSDVADWLRTTRWSAHADVSAADLAPVVAALGALGLVPAGFAAEQALARF
jgi:ABC-type nitrate/sulfonate/bicarbonate transport system substrate-binding protein